MRGKDMKNDSYNAYVIRKGEHILVCGNLKLETIKSMHDGHIAYIQHENQKVYLKESTPYGRE